MEYRGKQYSIVHGLDGPWKWSIELDGHAKQLEKPSSSRREIVGAGQAV